MYLSAGVELVPEFEVCQADFVPSLPLPSLGYFPRTSPLHHHTFPCDSASGHDSTSKVDELFTIVYSSISECDEVSTVARHAFPSSAKKIPLNFGCVNFASPPCSGPNRSYRAAGLAWDVSRPPSYWILIIRVFSSWPANVYSNYK